MEGVRTSAGGPYEALYAAIADQRRRIATFQPVIFHAHSIDSHDWAARPGADTARNDPARLSDAAGRQAFLDELAVNYSVVCITDHMRCGYATKLARAAIGRDDITVLPGMEINCLVPPHYDDAIHVLAIFPPELGEVSLERIFADCGLGEPTERNGTETVRFDDLGELRQRIHSIGGVFVLAHIENSRRGHRARFRVDRGQTLSQFTEGRDLLQQLADEYAVVLANLRPDAVELQHVRDQHHYARFTAYGEEHQVACVAPADHHSLEEFERADTATLLKVPRADFGSVREALRFHETRVRLPGQMTHHTAPRIVGMRLNSPSGNGLFADTAVAFSSNLNCLVGPRGSGKSTVVEALRYVLGRNPQVAARAGGESTSFADLAQRTQAANLRDTRIELVYEHGDGQQTVLSAAFDESAETTTRAFTPAGDDRRVSADAVIDDFPVAIFSWSEMEVLGREPARQREVIDRLLPEAATLQVGRDALREQLSANREGIVALVVELERARRAHGGRLGRYRQYREAFNAINTPEAAALFADLDSARQRLEFIDQAAGHIESAYTAVSALSQAAIGKAVAEVVAQAPQPVQEWWSSGPATTLDLNSLDAQVRAADHTVQAALAVRTEAMKRLRDAADADTRAVEQHLRAQTRLSDEQDLLRDQRELARRRYAQVDEDRDAYLQLTAQLEAALEDRSTLLSTLADAQDALTAARRAGLAPLNEQLQNVGGDRLRITVQHDPLGDRAAMIAYLDESVLTLERAGQYRRSRMAERLAAMGRPETASQALVAADPDALGSELAVDDDGALSEDEARKLVAGCMWRKFDDDACVDIFDPDVGALLELAEQPIDDRVQIKLNGRAVDALSPGQRSSAMLPLIALAETHPLVIDQPEDNLDNAMVGDTLTRILADLKERRQIIVSTHNPNIVVGGDAEQVVVLDAPAARRAEVKTTGSIDDELVIEAVLAIMEGGREAFKARRRRYRVD